MGKKKAQAKNTAGSQHCLLEDLSLRLHEESNGKRQNKEQMKDKEAIKASLNNESSHSEKAARRRNPGGKQSYGKGFGLKQLNNHCKHCYKDGFY